MSVHITNPAAEPAEVLRVLQAVDAGHRRPAPESRWTRFLAPSFSDCLFLALMVLLFFSHAEGWSRLLLDGDTGWHIRAGEWVLAHGAVPDKDLFSFSKPAQPWYAWEWLADVIYAAVHGWLSLKGIALLGGLQIALFGTVLLRYMHWRGANMLVALPVALVAIGASSVHYLARPHLFTLVLLVVSLWILEADRRAPSRRVCWLIPITAVWTNLHGGFLAMIACLGVLAAGSTIEAWIEAKSSRPARWNRVRRYWVLTAACGAASLLNPYGIGLHKHIAAYLRSDWIREAIQEFQSPSFRNENILQFEVLLLGGLMTAAAMLSRGKIVEPLWILLWAHQALGSVRHITVYVTLAAPLIAVELSLWWTRWVANSPRRGIHAILDRLAADRSAGFARTSVWPFVFVGALIAIDKPVRWPADFPDVKFPTAIVGRHAHLISRSRVMTEDQWADYLIYRFYPAHKVYVDGRSDFYGPELGREYLALAHGRHDWKQLLDRRGFDVALLPASWPLATLLKGHAGWRVVEDDGKAVLFVRAGAPQRDSATEGNRPERVVAPRSFTDERANGKRPSDRISLRSTPRMKAARPGNARTGSNRSNSSARSLGPRAASAVERATCETKQASAEDARWRMPSGLDLVEFALHSGFAAPPLLREAARTGEQLSSLGEILLWDAQATGKTGQK